MIPIEIIQTSHKSTIESLGVFLMNDVIVGVDTGGTFTDIVFFDTTTGKYEFYKLPSTGYDPSAAAILGITEVLKLAGFAPSSLTSFRHGTTVGTNAVLEGKVGKTALVTTEGFKDVLELARQRRPHIFNLDIEKPNPIVPRDLRFEIEERISPKEGIIKPISKEQLNHLIDLLVEQNVSSVAVCFLHSYLNDEHEREAVEFIQNRLPDIYVCSSSEVIREFREYERFCSTVLNASLLPVMDNYLQHLEQEAYHIGMKVTPKVMQSNGGIMSTKTARKRPVSTFLSGPAAGIVGSIAVAKQAGIQNFITFDMGGTSTDVCLVYQGQPTTRRQQTVAGLPVMTPTLDIYTVGAGGGSIAWIDAGGLLKVGPRSAGAVPGPACYLRGGIEPTVTDANLCLGRINPGSLLNGRMELDSKLAIDALTSQIGNHMDLDASQSAVGVLKIVTTNIVQAIRLVSVEKGYDPHDFALVAFGGAGPLHAAEVARELGISQVVIPSHPGLMCAAGLIYSDLRSDFSKTSFMLLTESSEPGFKQVIDALKLDYEKWLSEEGYNKEFYEDYIADIRYIGQDFELNIPFQVDHPSVIDQLKNDFHEYHYQQFGYSNPDQPVELVAVRLIVTGLSNQVHLPTHTPIKENSCIGFRDVWYEESGYIKTPIYSRERLSCEDEIKGPAIIEQMDSTTVLLPGMIGKISLNGTLIISWTM
jgi:N-methylhydantoinase A